MLVHKGGVDSEVLGYRSGVDEGTGMVPAFLEPLSDELREVLELITV
jgi:hypothetical protein